MKNLYLEHPINSNLEILVQMKKLLIFSLLSVGLNAQYNYQALVKHSSGGVISNNQVKIKFSIMYDSSTATPIFIEEHDITIPDNGVVNLSVGGGTVLDGTFSDLDWSRSVFMKEELDTGSGYQDMGTKQIASVPVAEYAKSISNIKIDPLANVSIGSDVQTNILTSNALPADPTGYAIGNTGVGHTALKDNVSGKQNTAVGIGALYRITDGDNNSSLGNGTFLYLTDGSNNTAIGNMSGALTLNGTITSGDNLTFLGAESSAGQNDLQNATAIGANANVTASNTIQLGNVSVTLVNTSAAISANDYLINGGESLIDIVSQLPSSDDYAALTAEVAEIDIQTDSLSSTQSDITALSTQVDALLAAVDDLDIQTNSLSSTQSDITALSTQVDALLAAVDDLDIQTNSLSSTLSESNTSEIKSAQVVINSNDVVLFELGVLRFSWNNTYNTIQVKQSSSSEIVDNWYISGIIRSDTETYIQKSNMTYGLGDDGGYNDRFTPIWSNGFTSLMDGSIALGSAYSNFEFYITPMGSGSTPYDPVPTWQLRGHVDGYNQLTVTCIHAKFDGTSGW